jgi:hypothetical protein
VYYIDSPPDIQRTGKCSHLPLLRFSYIPSKYPKVSLLPLCYISKGVESIYDFENLGVVEYRKLRVLLHCARNIESLLVHIGYVCIKN